MASIAFNHRKLGNLTIDTGVDSAQWGYNINTQSFPTYGGEVVQILSVYIDDLTLMGTVSTYAQLGKIYSYFTQYMALAGQGNNLNPSPNGPSSYNLEPMIFSYNERNWTFKVYPIQAPGFMYDLNTVAPQWQVVCHVIDDSPDLSIIKHGIAGAAVTSIQSALTAGLNTNQTQQLLAQGTSLDLTGMISPLDGDPNTDPFETFDSNAATAKQITHNLADYYNSLIPAYASGDFSSITGDNVGSHPNTTTKKSNHASSGTLPTAKPVEVHRTIKPAINPKVHQSTNIPVPSTKKVQSYVSQYFTHNTNNG